MDVKSRRHEERATPKANDGAQAVDGRVEAVLEVLRGAGTADAIAARHVVTEVELRRWVDLFVEAGRAALAKEG